MPPCELLCPRVDVFHGGAVDEEGGPEHLEFGDPFVDHHLASQ